MEIQGAALTAVIVGLVQVAKLLGAPPKYAALISVTLGTTIALAAWLTSGNQEAAAALGAAISGIAMGLTASGLYSTGKAALATFHEPNPEPGT